MIELYSFTEQDIQAAFKAWFVDFQSNPVEFLSFEEDFSGEDGSDKYATGATKDFVMYLNKIKGE